MRTDEPTHENRQLKGPTKPLSRNTGGVNLLYPSKTWPCIVSPFALRSLSLSSPSFHIQAYVTWYSLTFHNASLRFLYTLFHMISYSLYFLFFLPLYSSFVLFFFFYSDNHNKEIDPSVDWFSFEHPFLFHRTLFYFIIHQNRPTMKSHPFPAFFLVADKKRVLIKEGKKILQDNTCVQEI